MKEHLFTPEWLQAIELEYRMFLDVCFFNSASGMVLDVLGLVNECRRFGQRENERRLMQSLSWMLLDADGELTEQLLTMLAADSRSPVAIREIWERVREQVDRACPGVLAGDEDG